MIHNYYTNFRPNNMYYNYPPIYNKPLNIENTLEPELRTEPVIDIDAEKIETENKKNELRIGPASISGDGISIFGFNLHIDDIIIIVVIIFLFLENKKDYLLLIILALMLFDISIDSVKNMSIFKNLFGPS